MKDFAAQIDPNDSQESNRTQNMIFGVTIDGASTRDIDDAIWLEDGETPGTAMVTVAVTDPTGFVEIDSPVDRAAAAQAFTHYHLEQAARPMLPRTLSENLGSLLENKRRNCFALRFLFDENDGRIISSAIVSGQFVSLKRLTYQDAAKLISAGESAAASALPESNLPHMLRRLDALAGFLRAHRRTRGSLTSFTNPLADWMVDEDGNVRQAAQNQKSDSYRIVEEFAILGNHSLAQFARQAGVPFLYRNHEIIWNATSAIGGVWRTALANLLQSVERQTAAEAQLTLRRAEHLWRAARSGMTFCRARYEIPPRGHQGLALDVYTHGTSPLRRYADLLNLRQIKAVLRGEPVPYDAARLAALAAEINRLSNEYRDRKDEHLRARRHDIRIQVVQQMMKQNKPDARLPAMTDGEFHRTVENFAAVTSATHDLPINTPDETELANGYRILRNTIRHQIAADELTLKTAWTVLTAPLTINRRESISDGSARELTDAPESDGAKPSLTAELLSEIHEMLVGWINEVPNRGLQLWSIHENLSLMKTEIPRFEFAKIGAENFQATGTVNWMMTDYHGELITRPLQAIGIAVRKRNAKALAAVGLWETALELAANPGLAAEIIKRNRIKKSNDEAARVSSDGVKPDSNSSQEPEDQTARRAEIVLETKMKIWNEARQSHEPTGNYVSAVMEYAARLKIPAPIFTVLAQKGAAHARKFVMSGQITDVTGEVVNTEGVGLSKAQAKQNAARRLFSRLNNAETHRK